MTFDLLRAEASGLIEESCIYLRTRGAAGVCANMLLYMHVSEDSQTLS